MTAKKPAAVPGEVTATEQTDGWTFKWTSPKGNDHLGVKRYSTKASAMSAGRAFARKQTSPAEED